MSDNSGQYESKQRVAIHLLQIIASKIDNKLTIITKLQSILLQEEIELQKYLDEEKKLQDLLKEGAQYKDNV